jgi:polar amino acid transport system substrate-binding protein
MMFFKRLVRGITVAVGLAAVAPASAQQVLKVGSTPTGVPFTFLDTKTNSIQGVMVDLITEIGKDAGFQVQIEPMQFSTLIASLTSNKIDIISAAMFATAARKEVIDFSDPIYTYGEGLLVPKTDHHTDRARRADHAPAFNAPSTAAIVVAGASRPMRTTMPSISNSIDA